MPTLNRAYNGKIQGMTANEGKTLQLTIHLDEIKGDTQEEIARALRYWAGNLKHYPLDEPHREDILDSTYAPIGHWEI